MTSCRLGKKGPGTSKTANCAVWPFRLPMTVLLDLERNGWGQRIVQFFRWKPSTYGQV